MAHILILTPQLPYPPHQGTTIRNFNLIAGLARRHVVDLLTFAPEPLPDCAPAPLRTCCRQIIVVAAPVRPLVRRARDTLLNPLPDMALRLASPAMHDHLARLLRENRYEVIQVEGIEMAPYLPEKCQALLATRPDAPDPSPIPSKVGGVGGSRLIFDDHNAEYLLQKRAFLTDVRRPRRWPAAAYSLVQWQKLARYERRVCQVADAVVAVSEADRQALQRLLPGLEVTVVPNGVDLEFYRPAVVPPAPEMGPHSLVFTGKMDYRPNVDAALWFAEAVLPLILAQLPDAHFYIVGQQPHPRLAGLAAHPAITITGRVSDTRPYIAGAGAYVVPLRIGGGTRLKVLEAMAMGRPIVSTRLGCDGFPFQDGREVRLADEPATFAAAVVKVLQDRELAGRLGQAARACVEAHYGWDAIVPLMERLYL